MVRFDLGQYHQQKQTWWVFDENLKMIFHTISIKTYVVGTHWNRLVQVILMNTHSICFYGELLKIIR